jgi:2',3'-cyclic-nucleotide 2'-phosphodiesterase (5'-nucleotidase family)
MQGINSKEISILWHRNCSLHLEQELCDLLDCNVDTQTFKTTEKGLRFLETYNQIDTVVKKPSTELMLEEKTHNHKNSTSLWYRGDDVTVVEIELAIKALDNHIERLEAKLSYLIESYDDSSTDLLLNQYEKQIATVKQEIDDMMEERQKLNRRSMQMNIVSTILR